MPPCRSGSDQPFYRPSGAMSSQFTVPEAVALPLEGGRLRAVGEGVAKRWLLFLLARRPLHEATALPLAAIVAAGPRLCQHLLLAIGDDAAVASLLEVAGYGELAFAGLAGAERPEAVVAAGEALREAAWQELASLAGEGEAEATPKLANRLAYLVSLIVAAALRAAERGGSGGAGAAVGAEPTGREPPQRQRAARALGETLGPLPEQQEELPTAVLLLEVEGLERLRSSESEEVVAGLLER